MPLSPQTIFWTLACMTTIVNAGHAQSPAQYVDSQPLAHGSVVRLNPESALPPIQRPELPSGARATFFANFLQEQPGRVYLTFSNVRLECLIDQWRPESVTVDLPRAGLAQPADALIEIVLPDGRIAKTIPIRYVPQPDVLIHQETVGQPAPPPPSIRHAPSTPQASRQANSGVIAEVVNGGMLFYAVSK